MGVLREVGDHIVGDLVFRGHVIGGPVSTVHLKLIMLFAVGVDLQRSQRQITGQGNVGVLSHGRPAAGGALADLDLGIADRGAQTGVAILQPLVSDRISEGHGLHGVPAEGFSVIRLVPDHLIAGIQQAHINLPGEGHVLLAALRGELRFAADLLFSAPPVGSDALHSRQISSDCLAEGRIADRGIVVHLIDDREFRMELDSVIQRGNINRSVVRSVVAHVHAQVDKVVAVMRFQMPLVILRDLEAISMGNRRVIVIGCYLDIFRHREIARARKQQPRRQRQFQRDVVIPIIQGLKGGIDR